jgi:uncharacterized protein
MSARRALPGAARPLGEFAGFLRGFGFTVATEQTITFLAAVTLLGPRSFADIRRAAHATLAPPSDRREAFDTLFDAYFLDRVVSLPIPGADEDARTLKGGAGPAFDPSDVRQSATSGQAATGTEFLARRTLIDRGPDASLAQLRRQAPARLPRRRGFRRAPAKSGETIDLRRTLRGALRNEGEVARWVEVRRRRKQRHILLLIDISGSMKAHTEDYLAFAHALTQVADRVETFTFGTRLTHLSRAMRVRDRARALDAAATRVEDWDGGTRIGEALCAFLAVPRFAGYARGALTLVLSDGLERGDPAAMIDAVRRLARRSWRLAWLTPLAADPRFRPQSAALAAILPDLDDLANGGSIESLCAYVLAAAKERPSTRWLTRAS